MIKIALLADHPETIPTLCHVLRYQVDIRTAVNSPSLSLVWLTVSLCLAVSCVTPPATAVPPTATHVTLAITPTATPQGEITAVFTPTASPTPTPAASPTPTPAPQLPLIEREQVVGLVLADVRADYSWRLLTTEENQTLNAVATARLLGGIFNYALHHGAVYTVRNNDVVAITDKATTVIPTTQDERFVYGFVGNWLLVGFVPQGEAPSQTMGELGAIQADGTDFTLMTAQRAYTIPIIAPDHSSAVYVDGNTARAWYADGTSEPLPYGDFRSGAFSPNGNHLALLRDGRLDVYEVATQQLVVSDGNVMMGGDGFMFPAWHPNGRQIAFTTYMPDKKRPFATRLLTLDGTIMNIEDGSFPVFSPDGMLVALYQNINRPKTILVNLISGQRFASPLVGVPFAWVENRE